MIWWKQHSDSPGSTYDTIIYDQVKTGSSESQEEADQKN